MNSIIQNPKWFDPDLSENEMKELYRKLNILLKIDFIEITNNLQKKAQVLSANIVQNEISKEELIVHMKKSKVQNNSYFPRLRNSSENEATEKCIASCSAYYGVVVIACGISGVGYIGCMAVASATYAACCAKTIRSVIT